MYTSKNFKTKKALKDQVDLYIAAIAAGKSDRAAGNEAEAEKEDRIAARNEVTLYAPGLGTPKENGTEFVEGPHYPEPHKWYAQVTVKDGIVVKVK